MTQLACKVCKKIITEHLEDCKNVKWLECSCGRMIENPIYEEKDGS